MKFGEAITLLNAGHPMTRKGWNGRGMFIIRAGGYSVPAQDTRPDSFVNQSFLERRCLTQLNIMPHLDMWTAQNTYVVGWLASQEDMLADDWERHYEFDNVPAKKNPPATNSTPQVKKPHWTQTPEGKKIMAKRKRKEAKK